MILIAMLAATALTCQELDESTLMLSRVRRRMSEAVEQMTNFTCLVTLERSSRSGLSKPWLRNDTVRFEIVNVEGRELFAWRGQDQFEKGSIQSLLPYGVVSTGEYALHARAVFIDGFSRITFAGKEVVNGREAIRWNTVVPLYGSGWRIGNRGRRVLTGSHGSFWVNPATLDVIRMETRADDLPPDFANTAATTWTDYSRVQLGSRNALLPQTAGLVLDEKSGKQNMNLLQFSHCRQYVTESTISFTDSAPVAAPGPSKPTNVELPAGLVLSLRLATQVDSRISAVGDSVDAVAISEVRQGGKVVVPVGATFHGRVRRIEKRQGPPPQYAVGLEFSELELDGRRILFFGVLERLDPTPKEFRRIATTGVFEYQGLPDSTQSYNIPEVPGVATMIFVGRDFSIPEGTSMFWRTGKVTLSRPKNAR
jgi:hypothetical protein